MGETGVLPDEFSFEFIAQSIQHALDELGIEKVNLLGCSYSSLTALTFAKNYPSRVNRLLLGGAMSRLPKRLEFQFEEMLLLLRHHNIDRFAEIFLNLLTNPQCLPNRVFARVRERLSRVLRYPSVGALEQFKQNTRRIINYGQFDLSNMPNLEVLCFTGEFDHFVPLSCSAEIASAFAASEVRMIPNADHMFHIEQFRMTVDLMLNFSLYGFCVEDRQFAA